MKSAKFILAVAIFAMLCVSCQKEGQFNPAKKVRKITTTVKFDGHVVEDQSVYFEYVWDGKKLSSINIYSGGVIKRAEKYYYDKKNRVTKIESTSGNTLEYIYNGKFITEIKSYEDGKLKYTYVVSHADNKISDIVMELADVKGVVTPGDINPFFFLSDEISSVINKSVEQSLAKGLVGRTYVLTWNKDNVSTLEIQQGGTKTTNKYEYDKNVNPLYGWACVWDNEFSAMFTKNNVVKRSISTTEGGQTLSVEENYTYTYNKKSFPVTKTWTGEEVGGAYNIEQTFEYEN